MTEWLHDFSCSLTINSQKSILNDRPSDDTFVHNYTVVAERETRGITAPYFENEGQSHSKNNSV